MAQVLLRALLLAPQLLAPLVEAPVDAVAQVLPLPLFRLLLLAANVSDDKRDAEALREALGEKEAGPKITVSVCGAAAA